MSANTNPGNQEFIDDDYPKQYGTWKGIPTSIDAAFTGVGNPGNGICTLF